MPISPYVARLRSAVGTELLLLPSVTVLPRDGAGRVLLVRHAGHDDGWSVLGGAVEPGESPVQAAVREAEEEVGVRIRVGRLVDVLAGPDYEVTYPNGDRVAYVTAVYEVTVDAGQPVPDGEELAEARWFAVPELVGLPLARFGRGVLRAAGLLPPG